MKHGIALILVLTICSLMLIIIAATGTFIRAGAESLDRHLESDGARSKMEDALHYASARIAKSEKVPLSARFDAKSELILVASASQRKFAMVLRVDSSSGRPACYYRGDAVLEEIGNAKRVRMIQFEQIAWDESKELVLHAD